MKKIFVCLLARERLVHEPLERRVRQRRPVSARVSVTSRAGVLLLLLLTLGFFMPQAYADSLDINYILQLAKTNNVDINEMMKRPHIGPSYDSIKNGKKPYLLVFADFTDLPVAAKYVNNGYQVYGNLQNEYGFAAYNTKSSENSALMAKFKIKTVPCLLIANPYRNEVVPVKPALYDNPQRLVTLLRAYLTRTR